MAIIPRSPGLASAPPPAPQLSAPVYVRVPRVVDEAAVTAITEAEGDVVVVNPKCRTQGGQAELRDALVDAGLPSALTAALGWSTTEPVAAVEPG